MRSIFSEAMQAAQERRSDRFKRRGDERAKLRKEFIRKAQHFFGEGGDGELVFSNLRWRSPTQLMLTCDMMTFVFGHCGSEACYLLHRRTWSERLLNRLEDLGNEMFGKHKKSRTEYVEVPLKSFVDLGEWLLDNPKKHGLLGGVR